MSRRKISEQTSLPELAALVSEALERAGITATLSGGAAVSIYSENRYLSEDLDFVTAALVNELKHALEPLGFRHKGRPRLSVFEHPACRWYLEFPPAALSFGGTYIDQSLRGGAESSWGPHQRNSSVSHRLPSRDILHPVDKVTARCRCRKGLAFRFINLDCFLHNLAKLFEHGLFVVTMATAPDQAGRAADVAVVLV